MDRWQLITFTLLGFNFLAITVIGAILIRAARRDHPRKPKRATEPRAAKLTTAEARAIVNGEMHPLEAWRLGAGLSLEGLAKISAETLRGIEARETSADQATQQAVVAAMLTSGATPAAQSSLSAHPATGADAGSSSSSGATGSDGGGGAF